MIISGQIGNKKWQKFSQIYLTKCHNLHLWTQRTGAGVQVHRPRDWDPRVVWVLVTSYIMWPPIISGNTSRGTPQVIMEVTDCRLQRPLGGQVITALASPGQQAGQPAEPVVRAAGLAIRALCLEVLHRQPAGWPQTQGCISLQPHQGHIIKQLLTGWLLRGHFRGHMKRGPRVQVDGLCHLTRPRCKCRLPRCLQIRMAWMAECTININPLLITNRSKFKCKCLL